MFQLINWSMLEVNLTEIDFFPSKGRLPHMNFPPIRQHAPTAAFNLEFLSLKDWCNVVIA